MKNFVSLLLIGAAFGLLSCDGGASTKVENEPGESPPDSPATASDRRFSVNSAALQKDFITWWTYLNSHVKLSQDFVGLDVDSTVIRKADFLQRLTSGSVVPFKVMVRAGVPYYRLYPVAESQADIKAAIKQKAAGEIAHFNREGQLLPTYTLTDIQGKTYTPATTQGKLVVLKCWFIGCVACVQEFPEVNRLVESCRDRSDILFISLAMDKKENLVNFLRTHELKYTTVPNMKGFMQQQLNVDSYPTHILLDRAGRIVKVTDRMDELKPFIDKQLAASL